MFSDFHIVDRTVADDAVWLPLQTKWKVPGTQFSLRHRLRFVANSAAKGQTFGFCGKRKGGEGGLGFGTVIIVLCVEALFAFNWQPGIRFEMHLTLEFGGGLELLFGSQKKHEVDVVPLDGMKEVTMESLLVWIEKNLLKERPEMFLKENSVRPGVLVLVNDSDWELCGRLETVLEEKDQVIFISTLHGG